MIIINFYIVEKDFIDMAIPARKLDRADADARRLHIHPEIGQALVLLHGRVSARDNHAVIAILCPAGPELLAIELPAIAVLLGAETEPGKV
jgi:hypothetical protein